MKYKSEKSGRDRLLVKAFLRIRILPSISLNQIALKLFKMGILVFLKRIVNKKIDNEQCIMSNKVTFYAFLALLTDEISMMGFSKTEKEFW